MLYDSITMLSVTRTDSEKLIRIGRQNKLCKIDRVIIFQ